MVTLQVAKIVCGEHTLLREGCLSSHGGLMCKKLKVVGSVK